MMTEQDEPVDYVIQTVYCMEGRHHLCNGKKETQMGKFDCTCVCHHTEETGETN